MQQCREGVCPIPQLLPTKHKQSRAETEGLTGDGNTYSACSLPSVVIHFLSPFVQEENSGDWYFY